MLIDQIASTVEVILVEENGLISRLVAARSALKTGFRSKYTGAYLVPRRQRTWNLSDLIRTLPSVVTSGVARTATERSGWS